MTSVPSCTDADREALVAYLYGECDSPGRARVEEHLEVCGRCAEELRSFHSVRESMDAWTVSEPTLGLRLVSEPSADGLIGWRRVFRPVWGLAAAAGVVLGVGLALGGGQVELSDGAFVFRFGHPPATDHASRAGAMTGAPEVPWQADLVALERELRSELAQAENSAGTVSTTDHDAVLQQVQRLISQSEQRLQRERALWLTEFAQELDMQRRADQQQLQQELGALEGYADYLVRVSER